MAQPTTTDEAGSSPASLVRVAVVDDHESVRLGLKAAFIDQGYEFVTAAATVDEFVASLNGREVDVVVLDLSLGDGSTVTDNVKRVQATGSAVLVHSIADRVASVREALAAGAAGVIPKSSATSTVLAAAATIEPHVRSLDAIHLATCALIGTGACLVTHDAGMSAAALALGFAVLDPLAVVPDTLDP